MQRCISLWRRSEKRQTVSPLVCSSSGTRDAEAYAAVMKASCAPPRDLTLNSKARRWAIQDSLLTAARVPLEVARLCVRIAELAGDYGGTG